jgi:3-hydroxy-3-methylglutaryl CoA synthase
MALAQTDKLEKKEQEVLANCFSAEWSEKTLPSTQLSTETGDIYTGSLYQNLASALATAPEPFRVASSLTEPMRVLLFSYGSGVASSIFILKVNSKLQGLNLMISDCLKERVKQSPRNFSLSLREREENISKVQFKPKFDPSLVRNNSFVLGGVDELGRRVYGRFSSQQDTTTPSKNLYNHRILSVSRQMLDSVAPAVSTHSVMVKGDLFKNFYKKTLEERLKIVSTWS